MPSDDNSNGRDVAKPFGIEHGGRGSLLLLLIKGLLYMACLPRNQASNSLSLKMSLESRSEIEQISIFEALRWKLIWIA